jgi:acylphosphatase
MKIKLHVKISGKVQGVWFRVNTKNKAVELGVNGWVKNTLDGGVEAIFEGKEKEIHNMVNWCLRGSPNSKVEKIEIYKKKHSNEHDTFSIIH